MSAQDQVKYYIDRCRVIVMRHKVRAACAISAGLVITVSMIPKLHIHVETPFAYPESPQFLLAGSGSRSGMTLRVWLSLISHHLGVPSIQAMRTRYLCRDVGSLVTTMSPVATTALVCGAMTSAAMWAARSVHRKTHAVSSSVHHKICVAVAMPMPGPVQPLIDAATSRGAVSLVVATYGADLDLSEDAARNPPEMPVYRVPLTTSVAASSIVPVGSTPVIFVRDEGVPSVADLEDVPTNAALIINFPDGSLVGGGQDVGAVRVCLPEGTDTSDVVAMTESALTAWHERCERTELITCGDEDDTNSMTLRSLRSLRQLVEPIGPMIKRVLH
eukprot:PhM_4_TR9949/c0_g1_i1/m.60422